MSLLVPHTNIINKVKQKGGKSVGNISDEQINILGIQIYSFIQYIFIEHLVCTRKCSGH